MVRQGFCFLLLFQRAQRYDVYDRERKNVKEKPEELECGKAGGERERAK